MTLRHLYFPPHPLQPLSAPPRLQCRNLSVSRCPPPWGPRIMLLDLQRSYRPPDQQVPNQRPSVSRPISSNPRSSASMLRISNQGALFQQKPVWESFGRRISLRSPQPLVVGTPFDHPLRHLVPTRLRR